MQQAHYFRDINYYMLEKINGRPEGVDIAPCPPPKYVTGLFPSVVVGLSRFFRGA